MIGINLENTFFFFPCNYAEQSSSEKCIKNGQETQGKIFKATRGGWQGVGECLMFSRTVINWGGQRKGQRGPRSPCSDHRDTVMPGDTIPPRGAHRPRRKQRHVVSRDLFTTVECKGDKETPWRRVRERRLGGRWSSQRGNIWLES